MKGAEQTLLVSLGLHSYDARVLVALAGMGEGNTAELAEVSGVPRTSIYGAVATLVSLGLAEKVATTTTRRWRTDWRTVADGLADVIEQRADADDEKLAQLRQYVGISR